MILIPKYVQDMASHFPSKIWMVWRISCCSSLFLSKAWATIIFNNQYVSIILKYLMSQFQEWIGFSTHPRTSSGILSPRVIFHFFLTSASIASTSFLALVEHFSSNIFSTSWDSFFSLDEVFGGCEDESLPSPPLDLFFQASTPPHQSLQLF